MNQPAPLAQIPATPATLWAHFRKDDCDRLWADVPQQGVITDPTRPALEDHRQMSRIYYDVYNNGFCNHNIREANDETLSHNLKRLARKYGVAIGPRDVRKATKGYSDSWDQPTLDLLEVLAIKILDAALEEKERPFKLTPKELNDRAFLMDNGWQDSQTPGYMVTIDTATGGRFCALNIDGHIWSYPDVTDIAELELLVRAFRNGRDFPL